MLRIPTSIKRWENCGILWNRMVGKLLVFFIGTRADLGQDKDEAKTEAGQISIGILIFQDVWAIIVLAVQNHLDSPRVFAIAKTFTIMLAMVSTSAVFVTVYYIYIIIFE